MVFRQARCKISIVYTAIPMVFMISITSWAMALNIQKYLSTSNWLLFSIGLAVFALQIWMIIESVVVLRNVYSKDEGTPDKE